MKVSVVIPVYNGEKYIAECLDNMMRQTYKNLEIIVVDDGSTDGTPEIARRRPGIRVISFEKNRGPSAARNAGIDAATGEYIHFMDVDDAINDRFYELMAAAVENSGADMACCEMINERKPHRNSMLPRPGVLTSVEDKLRVTNVGRWGYAVRYLFRTGFLRERALRFEEGRIIEDMPFSLQAVYFANRIVLVPGAVYTYIFRPNSQMSTYTREHRRRRHRDHRHAKEVRHNFARKHRFTIPGVPTWAGPLSLFYVKWFT